MRRNKYLDSPSLPSHATRAEITSNPCATCVENHHAGKNRSDRTTHGFTGRTRGDLENTTKESNSAVGKQAAPLNNPRRLRDALPGGGENPERKRRRSRKSTGGERRHSKSTKDYYKYPRQLGAVSPGSPYFSRFVVLGGRFPLPRLRAAARKDS
nr:hypothetical protein CFP56_08128 [Quercus suber]